MRTGSLSVLTETVGTVVTKSRRASGRTAIGVSGRMNALTVAIRVALVIAQCGNVKISRFVYNDFGNATIKGDRPLRTHPPRLRDRSDSRFVGTPDQDRENLMRVRLIEVDERRRSATAGRGSLTRNGPADRRRFADAILGFRRRENLTVRD